ncbi:MAG: PqiA/YebS family transporter subunit [Cellvibrionaceae bacterium]
MTRPSFPISLLSKVRNIIACAHCGYINRHAPLAHGGQLQCQQCEHVLFSNKPHWDKRVSAFIITSIILFICSNVFPFLSLEAGFTTQSSTLLSGVWALYRADQYLLALLVFATIFIFPLVELLALSYIFIGRYLKRRLPATRFCLTFLSHSRAWNMLDIFMLGVLVTAVKLGEQATLIPGIGLLSFVALIIILLLINLTINLHVLWNEYQPENHFSFEGDTTFHACLTCKATISGSVLQQSAKCPRCLHKLTPRIRRSLQKTTALLVSAAILYIPALMLPIMSVTSFGRTSEDTILSGVIHLFQGGMWFIGLVVFVASILVPILKLLVLSYLLFSIYNNHQRHRKIRQRLFTITEFVGRWSMIDVFVITLLVALVQFGIIMNIRPEPAALAFAAVVILTMIAAETFDSRLIWDTPRSTSSKDNKGQKHGI